MKKTILLVAFVFVTLGINAQTDNTTDKGVVINGVKWATRNVNTPGTFASTSEASGMFYQWNRKKAWAATGDITGWDSTTPEGDSWEKANDPCPASWRMPSQGELNSLVNSGYSWKTINGMNGVQFGNGSNTVFLPAAGYRLGSDGTLSYDAGWEGNYWSSTQREFYFESAYNLYFNSGYADVPWGFYRASGFSCRCVAENYVPNSLESVSANEVKNVVAYYSITGQKLKQKPENGIYIVVYDNGTSEKMAK